MSFLHVALEPIDRASYMAHLSYFTPSITSTSTSSHHPPHDYMISEWHVLRGVNHLQQQRQSGHDM